MNVGGVIFIVTLLVFFSMMGWSLFHPNRKLGKRIWTKGLRWNVTDLADALRKIRVK